MESRHSLHRPNVNRRSTRVKVNPYFLDEVTFTRDEVLAARR
jgi:hypothetical protein